MYKIRYCLLVFVIALFAIPATAVIACTEEETGLWLKENQGEIHRHAIYPRKARRNKLEGNVLVSLSINADGSVDSVNIINPTEPNIFTPSVMRLKNGKFKPPVCQGEDAPFEIRFPIVFRLNN